MSIKEFGKKLKSAREERGMSQRGLGLALGLSDKTISSYESCRSFPNLDVLTKISDILDKPIEYFVSSSKKVQLNDLMDKIVSNQNNIIKDMKEIRTIIKMGE